MIRGDRPALGIEETDDRVRKAREIAQRGNDWFASRDVDFIEDYCRGKIEIGLWCSFGIEAQCGFAISSIEEIFPHGEEVVVDAKASQAPARSPRGYGKQRLMLPFDVQLMEGPQIVVPSLIRFQRFDDRSFGIGERLYEFLPLIVPRCERAGIFGDGEINLVGVRHAVALREGGGKDVEGATDGIDVCSHLDVERKRQRLFFDHHYDIVSSMTFQLFHDHAEVVASPSVQSALKGWQIGYGPVDGGLSVQ